MNTQEFYQSKHQLSEVILKLHERNELFRNIRHLCNSCQPPAHLTIESLTTVLNILKGENANSN